ncbi:MAG TPA: ABC transporter substrate-binding protein [Baekduia sp.]|uniref:ABC transporter substrate-binding protein n=1 Tax=Baekduia sp. TaxID=2600305 RepID=UPI002CE5AF22|nr:ABC transporter substrate-binding protein [Baekduia sp.]HMJ32995.1 ABC transporter substrate-binding protein [Baekduia sp.]
MGRVKMRPLAAVCAAGTIAIGLAACGTGSSGGGGSGGGAGVKTGPGVDAKTKTISLGVLSPLSGPVAAIGKPLTAGQETYFHAVNAAGGVDGWKVKLIEQDTKYDPQTEVQAYNRIAGNVAFIAQSLGSPTTKAIQPLATQQKMLIGAAAQDSSLVTDPMMAVIGTPYAIDNANALDYIAKQKGGKNAKVGIIYQNDAYGEDGLRGYQAGLKAYHLNSVGETTYKVGDTDLTAQVQKMRSAGARYVFVVATPSVSSTIVGTGASQGYNPTWVFQGPAWSGFLMTSDGTTGGKPTAVAKALGSNVWVLGYEAQWGDMSVPGMAKFLADQKRFAPSQIPDYYFMYGYSQAKMETAVLRKAIANGDLTRAGILDAKLHLGKVDLGGLVPPLDYTPRLGPASRMSGISKVSSTTPGFLKGFSGFYMGDAARSMTFQAAQ